MAKVAFHKQPSYLQLLDHIERDPYRIKLPDRKAQQFWESQYNLPENSSAVVDAATWDHAEQGMYVPPQSRAFGDVQDVGAPPDGPGPGMGPPGPDAGGFGGFGGGFGGFGFQPPPPGGGYGPSRRGRPTQPSPYADEGGEQPDMDIDFTAHQGGPPPHPPWQGPGATAEAAQAASAASAAQNTLNHMWWASQAPQPMPEPQLHDHGPSLAQHAAGLASTAGASILAAATNYAGGQLMGALNQHVVQPVMQPITANIAQGAQALGQAVAHGLGIGGAQPPVNNPGLYETLLGGGAPEAAAAGEAGMAAAAAAEGAELGAFGGPLGMAAGAGIGLAAAAAAGASHSWFNPSDPHTSMHAPILVAHGDAWHNPANASLPPAAQAHISATGHYIPAPPPNRKRAAEFFSLDTDGGFTADDEDQPASSSTAVALPRGTRRPATAALGDREKKGKVLHNREWEGKDRAPAHPRGRSKFQATEPIQGFTSSSESSGVVVATTKPRPPPPPPEQGSGYVTDRARVRPHALPPHQNPFLGPFSSGSESGPGASTSVGTGSLKTLQSALKRATKAKETILHGPIATNYRASASSSSRGPPPRPPLPPPPDSDSSSRRDRNTSARSGQ